MPFVDVFIFGMILGAVLYFIIRYVWNIIQSKKWNIACPVFVQRGEGDHATIVWKLMERGRLIKNKLGYSIIKLKKSKNMSAKPPQFQLTGITDTAQTVYPLFQTSSGQFYPMKTVFPEFEKLKITKDNFSDIMKDDKLRGKLYDAIKGKFIPMKMVTPPSIEVVEDASATNWGVQERRRIFEKFKPHEGFWSQYGQYIMNMIFLGVVIFMMIFMMTKFEVVSSSMATAADKISQGLGYLGGAKTAVVSNTTTNPPIVP